MIKIIVLAMFIGGPICALIWLLITHARHRGRMDAYDRIAKTFQNIGKDND